MRDAHTLGRRLNDLDGKSYGAYKQLTGDYDLGSGMTLSIDKVQSDPYAPPSLMRIGVDNSAIRLPRDLVDDRDGRAATADFLMRCLATAIGREFSGRAPVSVGRPTQEVVERTNVVVLPGRVEARITVALPAAGRRIKGREASRLLTGTLPRLASTALLDHDRDALRTHVVLYRDQLHVQRALADRGLVGFVGDGAVLPRRSGDSDLPLAKSAVPFASPDGLHVTFDLPSGGHVSGMGVRTGITVIVGGGYHGKSTLLRALERGVYPHIAGDGREWVITIPDATSIRAEDGRAVTDVDIAPFIAGLPSGTDTTRFSTTNASGSTSQAANLVESVDAGASALLIDEDTSATNFMIRDERMRALIPAEREPITPFVDRIRPLYDELNVSTVLVAGGSGAFFTVADTVVAMDAYVPADVTERAQAVAMTYEAAAGQPTPSPSAAGGGENPDDGEAAAGPVHPRIFGANRARIPLAGALSPRDKRKSARARGIDEIQFGHESIDLAALTQLVDASQTNAIAHALELVAGQCDGHRSVHELVAQLAGRLNADGVDALAGSRKNPGHLALPRLQEVQAALNRYRGLRTVR